MENLERIYTSLRECGAYFLATVDGDQAKVRPFGSLYVHGGKLYISTSRGKEVYDQMKKAPKVQLAAMGKDGWVRVTAKAVEEEDLAVRQELWRASAAVLHRDPDHMDDTMAAFYLLEGQAVIYKNGAAPESFSF